jgi:hypothetical protein
MSKASSKPYETLHDYMVQSADSHYKYVIKHMSENNVKLDGHKKECIYETTVYILLIVHHVMILGK